MDFSKLRLPKRHEKLLWLYHCKGCGEDTWFMIEMPEHMLRHELRRNMQRCGGKLVLIAMGYEHNDPDAWAARHNDRMRKRSEANTPKSEESSPSIPESTPNIGGDGDDDIEFENAHAGGKEHPLREDMNRIVETVFVVDMHKTWRKVKKSLRIGENRSDHGTLQQALDNAEHLAHEAHRLFVTAKVERDRWEAENDVVFAAMYSQASHELQQDKASGARSKQITDADVRAKCAAMFPDQWKYQETKRAKVKATVDSLANLSEVAMSRCRTLQAMLGKLRG